MSAKLEGAVVVLSVSVSMSVPVSVARRPLPLSLALARSLSLSLSIWRHRASLLSYYPMDRQEGARHHMFGFREVDARRLVLVNTRRLVLVGWWTL